MLFVCTYVQQNVDKVRVIICNSMYVNRWYIREIYTHQPVHGTGSVVWIGPTHTTVSNIIIFHRRKSLKQDLTNSCFVSNLEIRVLILFTYDNWSKYLISIFIGQTSKGKGNSKMVSRNLWCTRAACRYGQFHFKAESQLLIPESQIFIKLRLKWCI